MSSAMYVVIDTNPKDRHFLGDLLRNLDFDAEIRKFQNLVDFDKTMQDPSLLDRVKGIFISLDDNLDEILKTVDSVHARNPRSYFIICAPLINIESLRLLIQKGVSQILMAPYDLSTLSAKMKSAEIFQNKVLIESMERPSKSNFKATAETLVDNAYNVFLEGMLTENCELPNIKPDRPNAVLMIDCEGLKGISSVGIRAWLLWMKELKINGFTQVVLRNVHSFFLVHVRMIQDLIPENSHVDSFYLIYYNEEYDLEREFKFSLGEHFNSEFMPIPTAIECSHNGQTLVFNLDQQISGNFNFYKGSIQVLDEVAYR